MYQTFLQFITSGSGICSCIALSFYIIAIFTSPSLSLPEGSDIKNYTLKMRTGTKFFGLGSFFAAVSILFLLQDNMGQILAIVCVLFLASIFIFLSIGSAQLYNQYDEKIQKLS